MTTETEEFEFRLRAEREAAQQGGDSLISRIPGQSPSVLNQRTPAFEQEARQGPVSPMEAFGKGVNVGTQEIAEALSQPIQRLAAGLGHERSAQGVGGERGRAVNRERMLEQAKREHPIAAGAGQLSPGLAAGLALPQATVMKGAGPLSRIVNATATGAAAAPVLAPATGGGGTGDFLKEKGGQAAIGGLTGGALTSGIEGLLRTPGALKALWDKIPFTEQGKLRLALQEILGGRDPSFIKGAEESAIPGVKRTLAERTGALGDIVREKKLVPKITGGGEALESRQGANQAAREAELAAAAPGAGGEERVIGELQRIREAAGTPSKRLVAGKGGGEMENLLNVREAETKPMLDAFLSSGKRTETAEFERKLENLLATKPTKELQGPLNELKGVLRKAMKASGGGADPLEGITAAQRDKWGPAIMAKLGAKPGKTGLVPQQLDEVRQGINAMIDRKGEGALDTHAKEVLADLRNSLVGKSPKEYQDYLKRYGELSEPLKRFDPDQTVLARTTQTDPAFRPPKGVDAVKHMETVLSGKNAARDLGDMVEHSKHSPEQMAALRQSVKDWLIRADEMGEHNPKATIKRWNDMKGAIRESGLYDAGQMGKMESVMDDIGKMLEVKKRGAGVSSEGEYEGIHKTLGALGNAAGWVAGGAKGAYVGRQALLRLSDKTKRDVESMIVDMALNPERIEILSGKLTPAKAGKLQQIAKSEYTPEVEKVVSAIVGSQMAQDRKKPSPLSMRPGGL